MSDKPTTGEKELYRYELDPVTQSDEFDQHRARRAGLSLANYRIMRAYAAFKQYQITLRDEEGDSDGEP